MCETVKLASLHTFLSRGAVVFGEEVMLVDSMVEDGGLGNHAITVTEYTEWILIVYAHAYHIEAHVLFLGILNNGYYWVIVVRPRLY